MLIYIRVSSRIILTRFIPELSSGTWLGHFQRFGKIYFLVEMQIITGFDHICGIQNTEKYKYYEFTKYIGNINFPALLTLWNYTKLRPGLRASRGIEEAAADNTRSVNSSMKIYVTYIFPLFIISIFFCILDTTNMVKTCDYLYLNKEIYLPNL